MASAIRADGLGRTETIPAVAGTAGDRQDLRAMSTDLGIDALDADFLAEMFDPPAIARGRTYAVEDRVRLLNTDAGLIRAVCRGSGRRSYVVALTWEESPFGLEWEDSCSCPLGGACKHCVAVILTARASHSRTMKPGARPNAWRAALAGIAHEAAPSSITPLALQLAVGTAPTYRYGPVPRPRLTIRPMRLGAKGKWVKTGASWRELTTAHPRPDWVFGLEQRGAVRALSTSSRADRFNLDTIDLALVDREVWGHLDSALKAGVALIGERDVDNIEVMTEPAMVTVDLVTTPAGDLTMTVGFDVSGESVGGQHGGMGLIGSPVHGLWLASLSGIKQVPLSSPLHPSHVRVLEDPLTIPAPEIATFLTEFAPAVADHAMVTSSDHSVVIPASTFDALVLSIQRPSIDTAELRWLSRYRRGDETTLIPFDAPSRRGRSLADETAAFESLGLGPDLLPGLVDEHGAPLPVRVDGANAFALFSELLPLFDGNDRAEVELLDDLPPLRLATDAAHIQLEITDGSGRRDGNDWFDLGVTVTVDGETVVFASLFAALSRGQEVLVLPSGTCLPLDRPEFVRLRELIEEAWGLSEAPTGDAVARINRFQVSWWDDLTELGVVAQQCERWTANVARLSELAAPTPVDPPQGLEANLRHYQQDGFEWLAFLHRHGLGGILADDMGLGKTVQALALMVHVLDSVPSAKFVVVAPTSVVENWAREARRFAPALRVCAVSETEARRGVSLTEVIAEVDVLVTSYALFRLEFDDYAAQDWDVAVFDEAQFVKNHQGKTYQCVRRLPASTKVVMTGTPIENSLMDLWSLMSIAAPGLYPDPKRFNTTFRKPIEAGSSPELLAVLRRRIAPLMRRRTKDDVLSELPPKIEQTIDIDLTPRHARLYATQLQRQRQKVLGLVGDVNKNRFEIFRSLTLLRQLALDPGLVDPDHDHVGSAKLDRLLDDLTQIIAEGHRALVFSQFTRFLARARTRLDDAGIEYSYLDGRTRNRDAAISRFKDGDVPVFVISLKAGGVGLNLTEADYCFVLDPWWNPATEAQAVDRAHRFGQENPVVVYRYVSKDTIEEKVMELKARKASLSASVMDDDGVLSGALTENDIRGLLDLGR